MTHEEGLIRSFVDSRRQERYLEFISDPKKRMKFLRELGHFRHLHPSYATALHVNTVGLAALLRQRHFPDVCWVVSEDSKIDGHEMLVSDALAELGRDMGTFLSFVPGRFAYFENEDGKWMLERP